MGIDRANQLLLYNGTQLPFESPILLVRHHTTVRAKVISQLVFVLFRRWMCPCPHDKRHATMFRQLANSNAYMDLLISFFKLYPHQRTYSECLDIAFLRLCRRADSSALSRRLEGRAPD